MGQGHREKPFGKNLDSAKELNRELKQLLDETTDLPDRSLFGQRDRPKLMVFDLRTASRSLVNRKRHRQLKDHSGRDRRSWNNGEVFETAGACADMVPNQSLSDAVADSDGAADPSMADGARQAEESLNAIQGPNPEDVDTTAVHGHTRGVCRRRKNAGLSPRSQGLAQHRTPKT